MKGRVEGRIEQRPAPVGEELLDVVRARIAQNHDRSTLATRLNLETGVDVEDVRRALAQVDAEREALRAQDRASWTRAGIGAAIAGAIVYGVVSTWGGTGAATLSAGIAAVATAVVVVELGRRARG